MKRAGRLASMALAATLALAWASMAMAAGGNLAVHVGESVTLTLDYGFKEIAIGNPAVADYMVRGNTPTKSELLINGKQPGVTNLIVWDASGNKRDEYTLRVSVRDLAAYMNQLRAVVGKADGVRFRIAGEKVVIEGEAVLPADLPRIAKVVGDNPLVVNMVTLSPLSLKVLAESIQKEVGSQTVQVKAVGQKLMLSGVVYGKAESERIEATARVYYPDVVNLLEVRQSDLVAGAGDMVQVTAHFMEVGNSAIEGWGVNWSPGATTTGSASQGFGSGGAGFTGALVGTVTNLFPKFTSAKERGGARILETSSVSVRSGEKAEFRSGGEMGIPTPTQSGGTTMTFKEHGVFLNVLPISQGRKVTMRINLEVSAPSGTSPGGFINFKKSTMNTVQYCTSGDSVALGGLVSQHDSKIFDALPDSGSGAIFQIYGSEDFRKSRSQLVVFVTPEILGEAMDAHQELKGKVEESFDSYEERKR
jgi:pilus assembly protein CpaC